MRIWMRLKHWMGRRRFEADLEEEIRVHREMEREYRAAGGEGRYFGSTALAMEESREAWGWAWLDSLAQDVRYGWRGVRKSPGFALTVIGTIGLALGINTTLFTVFNTYVFRPIAVMDPHNLYEFWWELKDGSWRATWPQYQAVRRENSVFTDVAAYDFLMTPMDGRTAVGQVVSGNFFGLLAPGAQIGRLIEPDDVDAVVLSFPAWRNRFGGDPAVIGRQVRLHGGLVEVIGVTRPGFNGVGDFALDFWVTANRYSTAANQRQVFRLLGRLKPGTTPEAARDAVRAWARANVSRGSKAHIVSRATPIEFSPQMVAALSPVFAAFGLVLAIACVNVSNMMLARALSRHREMGIRVSLGAGRGRLVRQLLTESLLLAMPAAAVGIAISVAMLRFGVWLLLNTLPPAFARIVRVPEIETDWRVFAFVLLASAGAALLFGLAPALQTTRSRLVESNRGDFSLDHRPSRLRSWLVMGQVAVCALLTICSGVAMRSQRRVSMQEIGMRTEGVFGQTLSQGLRPEGVQKLRASPGIETVAVAWRPPIYNDLVKLAVIPAGGRQIVLAGYNFVSPEYFGLLRISVVRGRVFTAEEAKAGAGVAVISEATARRFWPGRDALGESIAIVQRKKQADFRADRAPASPTVRVIGVVGDVVSGVGATGVDPTSLYFPTSADAGQDFLMVGVAGGKEAGRQNIRQALEQIAPDLVDQITPLDELHNAVIYPFRIAFWIAGFLAGVALLLNVTGIYGVMSYVVSQRTKEIGIRMALGAGGGAMIRMVVLQCMRLVLAGIGVGAVLALALAPLFANQVEAIQPYDAMAYVGAAAVVAVAALAASWQPARRAVGVDPLAALRCD